MGHARDTVHLRGSADELPVSVASAAAALRVTLAASSLLSAVAGTTLAGATLTALYVVDPYPFLGVGEINPMGFDAYMGAARSQGTAAHAQVRRRATEGGTPVAVTARLLEDVSVMEGILATIKQDQIDLVVVGSHGRTGLTRLMLGSVASKVVAQSPVPVLVTR
jgi:nucleotide-binding universal stress UspA family protein